MSSKPRDLDCTRMKDQIQRKLMAEQAGMTLAERQRDMESRILADPVLGPWFRQLKAGPPQSLAVAEGPTMYRARKGQA